MHHIVLWKWQQAGFRVGYTSEHVNVVADMVRRHAHGLPLRIVCVTDDPAGIDRNACDVHPLWADHDRLVNRSGERLPSCYRRLKIFDPVTQGAMGIAKDDRVCSLDLDMIVANDLRPILTKPHHFVGWAVRGTHHLRVFNGSMFMFSAGTHEHMWHKFDPKTTPDRCHKAGYMGSDQSWLSYNFAKDTQAGTWAYPQLVSYPREVAKRPMLSKGTAVVSFHGRRKPWEAPVHAETPWVSLHWRRGMEIMNPSVVQIVSGPRGATTTKPGVRANAVATR